MKSKWLPTGPIRMPDSIISSKAREKNNFGFKPTAEYERRPQMNFLLSFEYQRMWMKDRKEYEKRNYAKPETNFQEPPPSKKDDEEGRYGGDEEENEKYQGEHSRPRQKPRAPKAPKGNPGMTLSERQYFNRGFVQKLMMYKRPTKLQMQEQLTRQVRDKQKVIKDGVQQAQPINYSTMKYKPRCINKNYNPII